MFSRRNFIALLGASFVELAAFRKFSLLSKTKVASNMIKPSPLRPGQVVGVVAPGTAVPSPDDLFRANEIIAKLGLRPKFSRSISKGSNYRTRSVQERLDDLMEMFLDKDVRAIFCIRGGYGSGQLLDKIDYNIVRNNPKIFVGYSDITALHIAFNRFANLVTFHGPVLLSTFSRYTFESLSSVIMGTSKKPIIQNPSEGDSIRVSHYVRTINSGVTDGFVIGGNLSIICSLLGTPYEYKFEDSILLLEDVKEEPFRIDRMLNQLRLSGALEKVKGIAFGECSDCISSSPNIWDFSLGEVIDYYFAKLNKPSCYGICIGHTTDQATFAIGAKAEFDADKGVIQYLEDVVS